MRVGDIVYYKLTEHDARRINNSINRAGNTVPAETVFPMIVVRVWGKTSDSYVNGYVNGQVFLDGPDTLWVTSVTEGDGPGTFSWYLEETD